MINAVIMGHNFTLVETLPRNNVDIQKDLWKMGLRTTPDKIFLSDDEDNDVQVKIYSDSDIGRHLCLMFDENDTLTQLNALCYLIQNSAEYLDGDIENNILHNQYLSRKELIDDIREAVSANIPVTETFYFPLKAELKVPYEGEMEPVDNDYVTDYADKLLERLEREQSVPEGDMKKYFIDRDGYSIKSKLKSIEWTALNERGTLFGAVEVRTTEPLTADEKEFMKKFIAGQNEYGFGKKFRENPITTEEGHLFISLGGFGDENDFIYDESEMTDYLDQDSSQQMGGM